MPASLQATGFALGALTTLPQQTISYAASDLVLEIRRLNVRADTVGVPEGGGTWDVSWLGATAGWMERTAFPTWAGNSVITAHVYDANGRPGPFVNLNQLWYGDRIIIRAWGQQNILQGPQCTSGAARRRKPDHPPRGLSLADAGHLPRIRRGEQLVPLPGGVGRTGRSALKSMCDALTKCVAHMVGGYSQAGVWKEIAASEVKRWPPCSL